MLRPYRGNGSDGLLGMNLGEEPNLNATEFHVVIEDENDPDCTVAKNVQQLADSFLR
jgi:hypothetical protein